MSRLSSLLGSTVLGAFALLSVLPVAHAQGTAPKVLVVTMFGEEAKPWLAGRDLKTKIKVPGLSADYPEVACDDKGVCLMTTAMGYASAASSVTAVAFSGLFDLSKTYVLIAGIAGVDPKNATLGSATWARYAIDGGLRHDIDARQIAADWPDGHIPLGAASPTEKAKWGAGTEVFALNEALVAKAFELTKSVALADGDAAKAYRAQYDEPAAKAAPSVVVCDTVSGDVYWHGSREAEAVERFAKLATDGKADYCSTQMEDNASLTALKRAADAGRADFGRVLVLRTASNFDREPPGKTPIQSLTAKSGGFMPSVTNAYRVGGAFVDAVVGDWATWEKGVPAK